MFEKRTYRCPLCHYEIRQTLREDQPYVCSGCAARFRIILNEQTGAAAFVQEVEKELPEPLYLPRGSIRALVALMLAGSCWAMIFLGRDPPSYLLSLILAVLGYYFAYRTKVAAARSRLLDPAGAEAEEPLFLPAGAIRWLLTLGFLLTAGVLLYRGALGREAYLEFFTILLGLIVGHLFGKVAAGIKGGIAHAVVNHVKGVVVLAAATGLVLVFLTRSESAVHPALPIALCAVISFYFGSRS